MQKFLFATILFCAASLHAADLPIKQIILYKHGVGYFQRAGQLGAGESARLDFDAREMNDVLKSLTVIERGGSAVAGLRYDSSEPLEKKLSVYPFQLPPGAPLSAVLDQLKGAIIEMKYGPETLRGAIVSGRIYRKDEKGSEGELITLLLDSGELRNLDLAAAASLRFVDPSLQSQFKQYLADLVGARSKEKRSVYIDSIGSQARQLIAEYMIPMPVWKSSYRLIWNESGEPTLEGWAIVDNTTGEDWNNVQMSLVSGRPISFISQLYEPRYVTRATAELPEDRALAPVVYEGAVRDEAKTAPPNAPAQRAGVAGNLIGGLAAPSPQAAKDLQFMGRSAQKQMLASEQADVSSTLAASANTQELGELFEYRFAAPVTIRKNESAMLPFLQQKISARKLLVYSDPNSIHPLHSAELTNSSAKTLDGGPITVYEDGAYAGEALVETLKAGDKRLISYGVDLGTRITTKLDSKGNIEREIHLRRGVLIAKTAQVEVKTYTIRNVDAKTKTLVIEHPIRPEFKVIDPKPLETTPNAYRFEVKLAANGSDKLAVSEERVFDTTLSVTNMNPDVLASYLKNPVVSDAMRAQLQQILDRKREIAAADGEVRRIEEQIKSLFQDQERLRQNINSLRSVSGQEQQVQSYARQLASQESQLATLRDNQAQQQKRKAALESELNELLEKMEF